MEYVTDCLVNIQRNALAPVFSMLRAPLTWLGSEGPGPFSAHIGPAPSSNSLWQAMRASYRRRQTINSTSLSLPRAVSAFPGSSLPGLRLSSDPSLSFQSRKGEALPNLLAFCGLCPCLFCLPPRSTNPYSKTESLYWPFSQAPSA